MQTQAERFFLIRQTQHGWLTIRRLANLDSGMDGRSARRACCGEAYRWNSLPDAHGEVAIGRCESYVGSDQTVWIKWKPTGGRSYQGS
jgi:hypothetical protein